MLGVVQGHWNGAERCMTWSAIVSIVLLLFSSNMDVEEYRDLEIYIAGVAQLEMPLFDLRSIVTICF